MPFGHLYFQHYIKSLRALPDIDEILWPAVRGTGPQRKVVVLEIIFRHFLGDF